MFNFNEFIQDLCLKAFDDVKEFDFTNKDHQIKATGNLWIIKSKHHGGSQ